MTILEFMWHIAKYSVFGVKVLIDPYPEPLEITGVNVRDLEFETAFGTRVIPKEFTKIQLYLYPLSHLDGDDLFRYQAWSRPPVDPEPQEKFLERMNNLEKLLCSRHIDYLDLISKELAIDATGKGIYGNME
jgi:hypothetical protein